MVATGLRRPTPRPAESLCRVLLVRAASGSAESQGGSHRGTITAPKSLWQDTSLENTDCFSGPHSWLASVTELLVLPGPMVTIIPRVA